VGVTAANVAQVDDFKKVRPRSGWRSHTVGADGSIHHSPIPVRRDWFGQIEVLKREIGERSTRHCLGGYPESPPNVALVSHRRASHADHAEIAVEQVDIGSWDRAACARLRCIAVVRIEWRWIRRRVAKQRTGKAAASAIPCQCRLSPRERIATGEKPGTAAELRAPSAGQVPDDAKAWRDLDARTRQAIGASTEDRIHRGLVRCAAIESEPVRAQSGGER
jgi:hypothetical protein